VRAQARHQLKQDRFAEAVMHQVDWATEHRKKLIVSGVVAAVVLALALGAWYVNGQRDLTASAKLGEAVRVYESQIVAPGTPATPGQQTFTSAADRAKAAQALFADIADHYGSTSSGRIARYFLALTYKDMGNTSAAETTLKKVADSRDKDLANLAKYALGELYVAQKRNNDAIALYKDLAAHPTPSVSKNTAQLELAGLYETMQQPQQAKAIYEQIRKDDPKSSAAQYAQARLSNLK
jgi:predicted negative regulator of RcsB-dependent stress response